MIDERLAGIIERWFITEPALFGAVCTHSFVENINMECPMRTGRQKIEYNPDYINEISDSALESILKVEVLRILLKHPYERRPDFCSLPAAAIGSNLVIGDNYECTDINIDRPADYELEKGKYYEWYCRNVQDILNESEEGNEEGSTDRDSMRNSSIDRLMKNALDNAVISELWEEDEYMVSMINEVIKSVKNWGCISGDFAEMLEISTHAKINWRHILNGFRASILSSKRKLTRMRPNRRTGFDNMGTSRQYMASLLVAVDVSGSISSETLRNFFAVINNAFRYGFRSVDVIQFDCGVKVVQSLKSPLKKITVIGRGGTSFDDPILYAHENHYDGLVIMTDGCAPEPCLPEGFRSRILWVCEDQECYDMHEKWMKKYGRVCVMNF